MNTLHWLIEAGVYGAEVEPLLAEVRRQGLSAHLLPYPALRTLDLPPDARVLAYGTFPFARQVQLHHPWKPGAWCDPTNLDCATYFGHFGRFLLNGRYALLPGVEAIRLQEWLFDHLGRDDEIFIRPSGAHKLFVGRCVHRDDFATALAPARYDPATLVVVAPPRDLGLEWRLVVAGDAVVAGSQYAEGGSRSVVAGCPDEVRDYAEAMLAAVRWRPDPLFMLDIAEADGGLHLVELNGFSTSWLYACDVRAVVEAARAIAEG